MKKKVAFIQPSRSWHVTIGSIFATLQARFPDLDFEVVNVFDLLRSHELALVLNTVMTVREYGMQIALRRRPFTEYFLRTPYIFDCIKRVLARHLRVADYLFSFQVFSLFDGSQKDLPHFVYTDHTHLANLTYPGFESTRLFSARWIDHEKAIYHHAKVNFVTSKHVAESLMSEYDCPPHTVALVRYGGNVPVGPAPLENGAYTNNRILFVGYDWERKGGPDLVAAFKQVLKAHPDAHLTIVGCTPRVDVPNCTVVGRVPTADVDAYYRRASIFCLPTKLEPSGSVVIEAYQRRLPVVTTNLGAMPDFVIPGENGYLVSPGSVDELASSLVALLDNPQQCKAFGESGYHLVSKLYTWDTVGDALKRHILEHVDVG